MKRPIPVTRISRWLPLALVALLGTVMIGATRQLLGDRIDAARERSEMQPVFDVLPLEFDNELLADRISLEGLPQDVPAAVYRARRQGQPVGVVVMPVVAKGYNGALDLAVGIAHDGALTGVRIVRHHETPGLGDQVHQQKSHWLDQFPGRSLANTPATDWAVIPDGGAFDGISGATITPRGVIRAVHELLARYASDPDGFYGNSE